MGLTTKHFDIAIIVENENKLYTTNTSRLISQEVTHGTRRIQKVYTVYGRNTALSVSKPLIGYLEIHRMPESVGVLTKWKED
eukprot:CFRG0118T1